MPTLINNVSILLSYFHSALLENRTYSTLFGRPCAGENSHIRASGPMYPSLRLLWSVSPNIWLYPVPRENEHNSGVENAMRRVSGSGKPTIEDEDSTAR